MGGRKGEVLQKSSEIVSFLLLGQHHHHCQQPSVLRTAALFGELSSRGTGIFSFSCAYYARARALVLLLVYFKTDRIAQNSYCPAARELMSIAAFSLHRWDRHAEFACEALPPPTPILYTKSLCSADHSIYIRLCDFYVHAYVLRYLFSKKKNNNPSDYLLRIGGIINIVDFKKKKKNCDEIDRREIYRVGVFFFTHNFLLRLNFLMPRVVVVLQSLR